MIPTLFGAALFVFFLLRAIPGDVCEIRLAGTGLYADPEEIALCQKNLVLDQPLINQFGDLEKLLKNYFTMSPSHFVKLYII